MNAVSKNEITHVAIAFVCNFIHFEEMENELRHQLLAISAAFARAEQCGLSMVSRRCRNDSGFFHRLADESKSFTARTFDEVMLWFSDNWPSDSAWPEGIDRPQVSEASSPSVSDSPSHAGGLSADPIPEISESPAASRGVGERSAASASEGVA